MSEDRRDDQLTELVRTSLIEPPSREWSSAVIDQMVAVAERAGTPTGLDDATRDLYDLTPPHATEPYVLDARRPRVLWFVAAAAAIVLLVAVGAASSGLRRSTGDGIVTRSTLSVTAPTTGPPIAASPVPDPDISEPTQSSPPGTETAPTSETPTTQTAATHPTTSVSTPSSPSSPPVPIGQTTTVATNPAPSPTSTIGQPAATTTTTPTCGGARITSVDGLLTYSNRALTITVLTTGQMAPITATVSGKAMALTSMTGGYRVTFTNGAGYPPGTAIHISACNGALAADATAHQ